MERAVVSRKVIIVGEKSVGKTSLINAFEHVSLEVTSTVSAEVTRFKILRGSGGFIELDVWDTAGSEKYGCLLPMYSRGAQLAILVYSQTSRESLQYIQNQYTYLSKEIGIEHFIIACNKTDQEEKVPIDEVKNWAKTQGIRVIRTSAKNSENVINLFISAAFIIDELCSKEETLDTPKQIKENKDNQACL